MFEREFLYYFSMTILMAVLLEKERNWNRLKNSQECSVMEKGNLNSCFVYKVYS